MAVKWIDFMQNTEGDGSYLSPWSGYTTYVFSPGDELRIKAVDKSTIFDTDWTYDIYYTKELDNKNLKSLVNLTLSTQYVYYIEELDFFFMTGDTSSSSYTDNSLGQTVYYWTLLFNIPFPSDIISTVDSQKYTLKRVSLTYNRKAYSSSYLRLRSSSVVSNVTISDGWINETTRVTDGTAITMAQCSYTSSSYFEIMNFTDSNIDLSNFVLMPYQATTLLRTTLDYLNNTIVNMYQIYNNYSYSGLFINRCNESTLNFHKIISYGSSSSSTSYASFSVMDSSTDNNIVINIDNFICYYFNLSNSIGNDTTTINIKNIWIYQYVNNGIIYAYYSSLNKVLNFLGKICYSYGTVSSPNKYLFDDYNSAYNHIKSIGPDFELYSRTANGERYTSDGLQTTVKLSPIIIGGSYGSNTINLGKVGYYIDTIDYLKTFLPITDIILAMKSNRLNLDNHQIIEYPDVINLLNISKNDVNMSIATTNQGNTKYSLPIINFVDDNESFKYLSTSNKSQSNNINLTSYQTMLSNNNLVYKTISPSIMIAGNTSTTIDSTLEFTNKWLMPVEKDIEYKLDFSCLVEDQLPNQTLYRDYNFVLKYDFGVEVYKSLSSLSVDNWEDFSIIFTPTITQIITLQLFITPKEDTILKAYISDLKIEPTAV